MTDYGKRTDGTRKGIGWLGEIRMPNGRDVMTEKSIQFTGLPLMPAIVPGMHPADINYLRQTDKVPEDLKQVAVQHALSQMRQGLPVFAPETPRPMMVDPRIKKSILR